MSNPRWLAVSLAIAFEIGAAASLASIIVLKKTSKTLVWALFILLTAMQMQGNMFYAYTNLENFQDWIDLFGLQEEELIVQKRILSFVSGAILPIIALGFIKSLVDYLKPDSLNKESDKITIAEQAANNTESSTLEEATSKIDEIEQTSEVPTANIKDNSEDKKEFMDAVKELTNKGADMLSSETVEGKVGNITVKPNTVTAANRHFYKP
jgi:Na+/phosphate symporter